VERRREKIQPLSKGLRVKDTGGGIIFFYKLLVEVDKGSCGEKQGFNLRKRFPEKKNLLSGGPDLRNFG